MLPTMTVLAALAWKAAVILMLAHGLAMILRRRSAAEKHLIWVAAMIALLTLPALERTAPAIVVLDNAAVSGPVTSAAVPVTPAAKSRPGLLAPLWLAGFAAIACYQLLGLLLLRPRRRGSQPFPYAALEALRERMGIRRGIDLYLSPRVALPMTWGLLRPVIMLPQSARDWSEERLRVVLTHELAHVRRFDFLTQFLSGLASAAFWYNPLVWTAIAAMRKEREKACDDAVLGHGENAAGYARHLLEIAAHGHTGRTPALAVPMAQAGSQLESRIRATLDSRLTRQTPKPSTKAALAVFTGIAVLSLVVIKTQAQANGGQLYGTVLDISGAVVPGAQVTATLADGSRKEISQSSPAGRYGFSMLPPGSYTVEVRSAGFAVLSLKSVTVKAGDALKADLTLEMGRVQETIDVVGKGTRAVAMAVAPSGPPQRIRVGGNVQATKIVYAPKPVYPPNLEQQGVEGTVLLEGVISMDGNLLSLRSLNSLVHPELKQAAMDAVNQWHYQPTLLNGKPVEVVTTITVNFRLTP